jgi:hypothetical protein
MAALIGNLDMVQLDVSHDWNVEPAKSDEPTKRARTPARDEL